MTPQGIRRTRNLRSRNARSRAYPLQERNIVTRLSRRRGRCPLVTCQGPHFALQLSLRRHLWGAFLAFSALSLFWALACTFTPSSCRVLLPPPGPTTRRPPSTLPG